MSLRVRFALYALGVVGLIVGCLYWGASYVLLDSFSRLEDEQMLQNLSRAERAWDGELARLTRHATDYAAWDDTYEFAVDHNPAYVKSNLTSDILVNLDVNFLAYLDRAGKLIASEAVDLEFEKTVALPASVETYLSRMGPLSPRPGETHRASGLVVFPDAVLLVASAPILTSDRQGPVRGSVVMGRFLDTRAVQAFGSLTRMRLRFYRLDDDTLPSHILAAEHELSAHGGQLSQTLSETKMASYTLLPDLTGQNALLLQVQAPRAIYAQAQRSRRALTELTLAVGAAASLVLTLLLQRGVVARFSLLSTSLQRIAASGDATRRIDLSGRDELARVGRDIDRMLSAFETAQAAVRTSEARYARAVSGVNDGLWDLDLETGLTYYSPRFVAMLGHPEVARTADLDFFLSRVHPDDQSRVRGELDEHIAGRSRHFESEFRMATQSGYRWMLSRGVVALNSKGQAVSVTGSLTDISQRGIFDPLTGLPNRLLLTNRLTQVLNNSGREPLGNALLFLDLNRFKIINDSLGHHVGDLLLLEVARRLQTCIRQGDTVARLGGDEFVLLLTQIEYADVGVLLERVTAALGAPYELRGHRVEISASIGALWPLHRQVSVEDALRNADIAMFEAKRTRQPYVYFVTSLLEHAVARQQLEVDLRQALLKRELSLVYQPIVSPERGKVLAVEALLRWYHPSRGLVSPDEFIPVAEETGLITDLGRWVLEEVCGQLQTAADTVLVVAVNLSPRQLADPTLVDFLRTLLARTGVAPAQLKLEITEGAVMEHPERMIAVLGQLRGLGLQLAMDDFGTGYSSLSYVHDLPLDVIKIDRSFVSRMNSDDKSLAVVRTIMALSRRLGLEVIAEGVETEAQVALLHELGCTSMQGYYFSEPLSWEQASSFRLKPGRPRPSVSAA